MRLDRGERCNRLGGSRGFHENSQDVALDRVALRRPIAVAENFCADAAASPAESNLLSWGAGALVVEAPPSYSDSGNWSPESLLDELPNTGWATKSGDLTPKVFVFEMAEQSTITSLAFDTAQVETPGARLRM